MIIRGLKSHVASHSLFGWMRVRVAVWLCLLCAFRPGLLAGSSQSLPSIRSLVANCQVEVSILYVYAYANTPTSYFIMIIGNGVKAHLLVLTRICKLLGYANLGLGLPSYSASCSPSPKPSVAIARFVRSPNPKFAYPSSLHIRVRTSISRQRQDMRLDCCRPVKY